MPEVDGCVTHERTICKMMSAPKRVGGLIEIFPAPTIAEILVGPRPSARPEMTSESPSKRPTADRLDPRASQLRLWFTGTGAPGTADGGVDQPVETSDRTTEPCPVRLWPGAMARWSTARAVARSAGGGPNTGGSMPWWTVVKCLSLSSPSGPRTSTSQARRPTISPGSLSDGCRWRTQVLGRVGRRIGGQGSKTLNSPTSLTPPGR